MRFKQIVWEGVDWIDLGQDREKFRVLVKTVMNSRSPKIAGIPFPAKELLASQEEVCCIVLVKWEFTF